MIRNQLARLLKILFTYAAIHLSRYDNKWKEGPLLPDLCDIFVSRWWETDTKTTIELRKVCIVEVLKC